MTPRLTVIPRYRLLAVSLVCAGFGLACLTGLFVGCGPKQLPPPLSEVIIVGATGSMKPALKGGEILPVVHKPYDQLEKGDIALTYWGGAWHPHRLVSKTFGYWMTKGDANSSVDPVMMGPKTYGGIILP